MNSPTSSILDTIADLEKQYCDKLPPVHLWSPELNGDLDMRIDREGQWFYQGSRIERLPMVKMFSTILKREADDYFLVTPVEKWRIQVEVAPFLITAWREVDANGEPGLALATNVGTEFLLDGDHPMWVDVATDGSPLPSVMVRGNLPGLLSRAVYYQLAEIATEEDGRFFVQSCGERFYLG
ncbi:DUF1285 domain-containing protein [Pseudomaricurvus sp. HS19]|uniref:DUF1285 domain-containing protein n=1 Tax=Pseudomaricurvus sp. HS19 TaxID=2692626 RepID=UPI0013689700|nr:DUF1285 domain-containing protein [Pseudomaricurvus sp. HS19]MYM62449.1 DUF1285 domain-containing protein [Pseudomaricurvus sp. HS19]